MSYVKIILLVFLLSFLTIGGELYKSDLELGIERDIYNHTAQIVIPQSDISSEHPLEETRGIINEGRLFIIIESGINFMLVSVEQVSKMGIEYGYQNPEINFGELWKYAKYLIITILVIMLIKPFMYIIIFIVMIFIMFKERRDKKRKALKELR